MSEISADDLHADTPAVKQHNAADQTGMNRQVETLGAG